jgi:hypothetical protein
MSDILNWLSDQPGLAAWVQAVGSIIAIVSGFALAYWQHRRTDHEHRQERERADKHTRIQAQALALILEGSLVELAGRLSLAKTDKPFSPVDLPHLLEERTDQIYVMGETGGYLLQLISTLTTHNRMLAELRSARLRNSYVGLEPGVEERLRQNAYERLQVASDCLEDALKGIAKLARPHLEADAS